MNRLNGKVALVTGASKGIGAGIAKAFGAEGAAVIVNYATDRLGADRVVAAIVAAGGAAKAVQADVSRTTDVRDMFAVAAEAFGRVDVLVNNAGVYAFGPLESITEASFHKHIDVNVLGVFLCIQQAVAQFGPEGGSIINIATVGVDLNPPMMSLYVASKAPVLAISRSLAKELGPRHIRVNTISPGLTETEGNHALGVMGTDMERQLVATTPLGRVGQPDDIAAVAVFLACEESRWVTGETINASGGLR